MFHRTLSRFLLLSAVLSTSIATTAQFAPARFVPDTSQGAFVVADVNGVPSCRLASAAEAEVIHRAHGVPLRVFGEKTGRVQANAEGALNIILRGTTQLDANPEAKAAFERAAEIWETRIASPITVYVDVDFGPTFFGTPFTSEDVIAATRSLNYVFDPDSYPELRDILIDRADNPAEIAIYNTLPVATIPTDTGDTTRFGASSMLLQALGVFDPVADPNDEDGAPSIGFNSAFVFDFDPSDGIAVGQTDFEGVVVHEIGHMLGFTSRVGAGELDGDDMPSILDLFRFRPGVDNTTFSTAQRILSSGGDHVFFAGTSTLALSTGRGDGSGGDLRQASHWKDDAITGTRIGIMDPTLARGRRSELTEADLFTFGMLGYIMSTDVIVPEPQAPAAPTGLTATAVSINQIRLDWTDNATDETQFLIERKIGNGAFSDFGAVAANVTTYDAVALNAGTQYTFRVRARNDVGSSPYTNTAAATTNVTVGQCFPTANVVCLLNSRFKVFIDYVNPFSNPPNQPGSFLAARLLQGVQNPDTALFGFDSAQAVEVVVRIQDTRPFAPRFDVYYGGMTDVGYSVTVSDTQTGVTRQYFNTVGTVGGGVDRTSFPAN